jgi:probable addiction module antidote protein
MKTSDYQAGLRKRLQSPRFATGLLKAAFLEACDDGNWEAFGLTLQDVVEARGNTSNFAKQANVSRQQLYRLFGKRANPTLKTLLPLLHALGLRLTLERQR